MTMKKLTADDPESRSPDLIAENVERLKALFPELVAEGPNGAAVNVDVLKALVGDATVTDADEKYGLNWHGKRRVRELALTPSAGTLRPCPEDSVDWGTTQNLMIEGDNLEVLKLLQKSYAGKVKLIYIDPPYNTGKDFVYPDNFQDSIKNYLELTGQIEGGAKISSNTEGSGRFHTGWLNMMYPRLKLARTLLRTDGFLAVSISDSEVGNLRVALDEIFGDENLVETFFWESIFRPSNMSRRTRKNAEYVILYSRDASGDFELTERLEDPQGDASLTQNNNAPRTLLFPAGSIRVSLPDDTYPRGQYGEIEVMDDVVVVSERNVHDVRITGRFKWSQEYLDQEIEAGVSLAIKSESLIPYYRKTYKQTALRPTKILPNDLIGDVLAANAELRTLFGKELYSYPKPTSLLRFFIRSIGASANDIVMDFFAGSGTTGHAVMAQNADDGANRCYILVQLPEPLDPENRDQKVAAEFCDEHRKPRNIAELTKERLRRAAKKIKDETPMFTGDLGFRVFKLDSSNFRGWEPDRDDLDKTLLKSVEHLMPGRSEADVLYEVLLKRGLDLCVPIETRILGGKEVHAVGGGVLMACLAEKMERGEVEGLAQGIVEWRKALAPAGDTTCVFRDSAFADDVAKTNLAAILEQHGIANVRSL